MTEINGISVPFIPITPSGDISSNKVQSGENSFNSIFQQELEKIKFSSHALKRLENRNIQLNQTDINKIQDAVSKAEQRGSKDSLVMVNDTGNVPTFVKVYAGLAVVEAPPASKFQANPVIAPLPTELSDAKFTVNGAIPVVLNTLIFATGGMGGIPFTIPVILY